MAAYVIADVKIEDPVRYEDYKRMVPATLAAYGGRFIARGGRTEVLEGEWRPNRVVIIEFESVERAKEWWASEEYRAARELRQRTSTGSLIVIEGLKVEG
jgi:uncharacterized protein (DUF1330 family)